MTTLTAQQFYDLLEAHGLKPQHYDDVPQPGHSFPAFLTDNPVRDTAKFLYSVACGASPDTRLAILYSVCQAFKHARKVATHESDIIVIMYFPTLRFPKGDTNG